MDHREVGRRLGFPECCIHQFITDIDTHTMSGAERGAVYGFRPNGTLSYYVPCQECIDEGLPFNWERPHEWWGSELQCKYISMFWENGEYTFDGIGQEYLSMEDYNEQLHKGPEARAWRGIRRPTARRGFGEPARPLQRA